MTEETPIDKVERMEWIAEDKPCDVPESVRNRFETIGNKTLAENALSELNRVDARTLDSDEVEALADALQGVAYLSESLAMDYEVTDDD